uniref:Uncharacterized protein n=1 Tax=Tetraselmis sp. GSL018 TaxID=582737 RepID=A0A061SPA2_9CHLO|mmetsp:Transcript_5385/g.13113  ORF Transcript_5385/g.13113 Transcript_5385/m.13113 type:complete len:293 (-) Transcript_5385:81-959(-)|eukprot:CAMPEP_0177579092 /NCGR_PEP_ID=MMETSP0419_2-20121207/748_1 /TAXON_ID=582737 /ORGANISM="Tetraselmis sp., Strain GSL018" /LENGTH=292 /DNA_ID=CAMNT_0019067681 /DNA_START=88 /DNA_END=966 /DNA_ORIENTATION=-
MGNNTSRATYDPSNGRDEDHQEIASVLEDEDPKRTLVRIIRKPSGSRTDGEYERQLILVFGRVNGTSTGSGSASLYFIRTGSYMLIEVCARGATTSAKTLCWKPDFSTLKTKFQTCVNQGYLHREVSAARTDVCNMLFTEICASAKSLYSVLAENDTVDANQVCEKAAALTKAVLCVVEKFRLWGYLEKKNENEPSVTKESEEIPGTLLFCEVNWVILNLQDQLFQKVLDLSWQLRKINGDFQSTSRRSPYVEIHLAQSIRQTIFNVAMILAACQLDIHDSLDVAAGAFLNA